MKVINLLPFLLLFMANLAFAQEDGTLDLSFGMDGKVTLDFSANGNESDDSVEDMLVQSDGKIVVAGSNSLGFILARFQPNGTLDQSFGVDGKVIVDVNGNNNINMLAIQADGKILLSGDTQINAPNLDFVLIRLNTDGSMDDSFGTDGIIITDLRGNNDYGTDILVQEDGKILQTGNTDIDTNLSGFALVRYLSDGSLDDSFGSGGIVETAFPNGYIEAVSELAIQADQKIVAAGWSLRSTPGGLDVDIALARYLPDGNLDLSFGEDGMVVIENPLFSQYGNSIAIQADGKILVEGGIRPLEGFSMIRLTEDGELDDTFGNNGIVITKVGDKSSSTQMHLQADQKILLSGSATQMGQFNFTLLRYLPDGNLDPTFGTDGIVETAFDAASWAYCLHMQKDGKILLAGTVENTLNNDFVITRYLNDLPANTQDLLLQKKMALTLSPNPINSTGTLAYTLPQSAKIQINLYNQAGQWVQNILAPTTQGAGAHQQAVQIKEDLAPGIYHLVLDDQEKKYNLQIVKK